MEKAMSHVRSLFPGTPSKDRVGLRKRWHCRNNLNSRLALENLKRRCERPLPAKEGVEPTNLFSKNDDVNQMNETRLRALEGDEVVFSPLAVDL